MIIVTWVAGTIICEGGKAMLLSLATGYLRANQENFATMIATTAKTSL